MDRRRAVEHVCPGQRAGRDGHQLQRAGHLLGARAHRPQDAVRSLVHGGRGEPGARTAGAWPGRRVGSDGVDAARRLRAAHLNSSRGACGVCGGRRAVLHRLCGAGLRFDGGRGAGDAAARPRALRSPWKDSRRAAIACIRSSARWRWSTATGRCLRRCRRLARRSRSQRAPRPT